MTVVLVVLKKERKKKSKQKRKARKTERSQRKRVCEVEGHGKEWGEEVRKVGKVKSNVWQTKTFSERS